MRIMYTNAHLICLKNFHVYAYDFPAIFFFLFRKSTFIFIRLQKRTWSSFENTQISNKLAYNTQIAVREKFLQCVQRLRQSDQICRTNTHLTWCDQRIIRS